jgi:apoptosis-inducing factor 3
VARFPYGGELVRIEHFAVAERQGRSAALSMLGKRPAIADVPFFWSQHHDVTLSYVGHAERWDRIEVRGSREKRDALVAYVDEERVRAVVTLGRDHASLLAERAMETGDEAALRALLAGG